MEHIKILKNKKELPAKTKIIDTVPTSIVELFLIRNPAFKDSSVKDLEKKLKEFKKDINIQTIFAYYPWSNTAIHMLPEKEYFELRTARNKNIITQKQQEKYRKSFVGIVGLSVGSNILNALTFSGGAKKIKLADYDTIEITNLNRLRAPLHSVGENKAKFAAKQVWDLDPFADLEIWEKGIDKKSIKKFILNPRLDIFVDEMDDLNLKIMSRIICKNNKIPVVMITDNGDNVIIDIERFDKEFDRKILHGLIENDLKSYKNIDNIPYKKWVKLATKIVDPKNLTKEMQKSLKEIGKTITAVPQLGTTATIGGAAAAYVIRKIANDEPMPSGRYFVKLDNMIKS